MGYGSSIVVGCGIILKCGLDPTLLWLWYRPGATALIRPLSWELPCAKGVHLKRKKCKKKNYKCKQKSFYFLPSNLDCFNLFFLTNFSGYNFLYYVGKEWWVHTDFVCIFSRETFKPSPLNRMFAVDFFNMTFIVFAIGICINFIG